MVPLATEHLNDAVTNLPTLVKVAHDTVVTNDMVPGVCAVNAGVHVPFSYQSNVVDPGILEFGNFSPYGADGALSPFGAVSSSTRSLLTI